MASLRYCTVPPPVHLNKHLFLYRRIFPSQLRNVSTLRNGSKNNRQSLATFILCIESMQNEQKTKDVQKHKTRIATSPGQKTPKPAEPYPGCLSKQKSRFMTRLSMKQASRITTSISYFLGPTPSKTWVGPVRLDLRKFRPHVAMTSAHHAHTN